MKIKHLALIGVSCLVPGGFLVLGAVMVVKYLKKHDIMKNPYFPFAHCPECVRIVKAKGTIIFLQHLETFHNLPAKYAENFFAFVYGRKP